MAQRTCEARKPSIVALGLVVVAAPVATDAYLGAMPVIERDLGTGSTSVQATLMMFLIGFAVGQLVGGALSDRIGRRTVLVAALAWCVVIGAVVATAFSIEVMLVARALHGIAAGAAAAAARASVADAWAGRERAQRIATLSAMLLVGPIVAPVLGGALLVVSQWRIVLLLPVALGVMALVAVLRGVPVTHRDRAGDRRRLGPKIALLHEPVRRQIAVSTLAAGATFSYVSASPFIFRTDLSLDSSAYSLVFAGNAGAMILGSLSARRLVRRVGVVRIQRIGLGSAAGAAAALLVLSGAIRPQLALIWPLLALMLFAAGAASVATSVLLQDAADRDVGAAIGLQGAMVFVVGASIAPLTGLGGTPTIASTTAVIMGCLLAAVLAAVRPLALLRAPLGPDQHAAVPVARHTPHEGIIKCTPTHARHSSPARPVESEQPSHRVSASKRT